MISDNLNSYCRSFSGWDSEWPNLPCKNSDQVEWWDHWLKNTSEQSRWNDLRLNLPQLMISPTKEARLGSQYKRLVLQGVDADSKDIDGGLREPDGFSIFLKEHWCGSIPVVKVKSHTEFTHILQCLVYRCEPVRIQRSVHSQAVSGLIHWGLIKHFDNTHRCSILVLHDSPYSSISFNLIPGMKNEAEWIHCSYIWRLEHELTHVACKSLVGEMRLNLYDELLADSIGMRASLGYFDATLFGLTMGINCNGIAQTNGRVHTYTKGLNDQERLDAQKLVMERAYELDELLSHDISGIDDISLLKILTRNKLDRKLSV